jgi:hypothetical protein
MDVLSPVSAGFALRSACTAVASAKSKGDHQVSALRILLNDNNTYRQGKEGGPYEGWRARPQDPKDDDYGWSTRSKAK